MMMEVARRERPKQSHGDIAQSWPGLTFPGVGCVKMYQVEISRMRGQVVSSKPREVSSGNQNNVSV